MNYERLFRRLLQNAIKHNNIGGDLLGKIGYHVNEDPHDNHGHTYEPDFVVETEQVIYLVEVKGEDKLNDPDVIAKKERGVQYCAVASRWGKSNGYKEWRYLFLPAGQIRSNSSFEQLAERFKEM